MDLGNKIRRARGKISQVEVAKKLSISANTLSAYENNRVLPPYEIFKKICQMFDLSADMILEIDDVSNTPSNMGGMMLGNKLANIRDKLDLTQEEIAFLVQVSVSTWSKYESGNRTPPLDRFWKICKICKVSANYLLGLQNNKN